jgi:GTP-binding protein Era
MEERAGSAKCGFVAIIGAPNAGKSTLLNRYLDQKVAITAPKPQTTRHRILGVRTEARLQIIFWDTPGYHSSEKALNRGMVSRALAALADADVCLWLVDGRRRGAEHAEVLELVKGLPPEKGLVAAINKTDAISAGALSELAAALSGALPGRRVLPVSAKTGRGLGALKRALARLLPDGPLLYPDDALTDQPMRLLAAEFVREAVFRLTRQELPYSTAVTVDEYTEPAAPEGGREAGKTYIAATIHVEKENQKAIMIGRKGALLQEIGRTARLNIERLVGGPVYLELFVRITKDWSRSLKTVRDFGYGDKA